MYRLVQTGFYLTHLVVCPFTLQLLRTAFGPGDLFLGVHKGVIRSLGIGSSYRRQTLLHIFVEVN